jgi:hypothetical protein
MTRMVAPIGVDMEIRLFNVLATGSGPPKKSRLRTLSLRHNALQLHEILCLTGVNSAVYGTILLYMMSDCDTAVH